VRNLLSIDQLMKKISDMEKPKKVMDPEAVKRVYFENRRGDLNGVLHAIIDGKIDEGHGMDMVAEIVNEFHVHEARGFLNDRFLNSLIARFERWEMFEDCAKCLKLKTNK
jgi:aminoglycoside phosphotransferase family enzyme